MAPSEPKEKGDQDRESLLKIILKRLKLRHLVFLVVALISLAITFTVIIVLLRISTLRITDVSPDTQISGNDYLGIIGVLVALAAAFIGALATIMFGNTFYNTYISRRAEEKIRRHEKYIPNLYALTLNNEANESEKEGDILRAIEYRIGVIHFALKNNQTSRINIIKNYQQSLNITVRSLNPHDLIYYYNRLNLNKKATIQEITYAISDIHGRISDLAQSDKGNLLKLYMDRIMTYVDKQAKDAIDTIKSGVEKTKMEVQSNDYMMHI